MKAAEDIIGIVCRLGGIAQAELLGGSNKRHVVLARHVAMWVLYRHAGMSKLHIGRLFGRNHATVHYAIMRVHDVFRRPPRTPDDEQLRHLAERADIESKQALTYGQNTLDAYLTETARKNRLRAAMRRLTVDQVARAVLIAFSAPAAALTGTRCRWAGVHAAYVWLVTQYMADGDPGKAARLCCMDERMVRTATQRAQMALRNDVFKRRLEQASNILLKKEQQPCPV